MSDDILVQLVGIIAGDDFPLPADVEKAKQCVAIIEAPLRAENEKLRSENEKLVAQSWVVDAALLSECEENEKLRAALKRIAEQDAVKMALDPQWARRAAAAALKETGDE